MFSCCVGGSTLSFQVVSYPFGAPILRWGCRFVDHTRRLLAIVLLFCAAGAEVPRQVLIRAHNLAIGTQAPAAATQVAHETADTGPGNSAQSPAPEQPPLANAPLHGGDTYWFFEVPTEGAAVVPRRDRMSAPTYDGWANELCCAAGDYRRLHGFTWNSRSDCHRTGSAVVVSCRLIPLRT